MTLRSLDDGDLDELIARLEAHVRYHASLDDERMGRFLLEQLRGQLTEARLERERRAD
jgi:hypothetical protein